MRYLTNLMLFRASTCLRFIVWSTSQNELIQSNCNVRTKSRKMNVNKISKWFTSLCVYLFIFFISFSAVEFQPLGMFLFFPFAQRRSLTVTASLACDHKVWKSKGLSGFRQLSQVVSLILDEIVYNSSKTH